MKDLVSIIMPAYNAEKTIEESINSVLLQDYVNWELLIVDDCSSDNTKYISSQYAVSNENVRYFRLGENSGVAEARNFAIKKAKGRYIAFLDSDDLWYQNKLSCQLEFMNKMNSAISCTNYEVIDEDSDRMRKYVKTEPKITFKRLLKGSIVGCLTVIIDSNRVDKEDIYMQSKGHEDYITWLNVSKKYGPIDGLDEILAKYRVFDDSLSSNKKRAILWQYKIYREEFGFGIILSFYYLLRYGVNAFTKYRKL